MMIRGGTAPLRIECGRWRGLERAERTCGECELGKVEDVQHWLLECERWKDEGVDLFQSLSRVALGFDLMTMMINYLPFWIKDASITQSLRLF